jgi:hypothetical protein
MISWRIGDAYFDTYTEAEQWADVGNIGGTYSIIPVTYCEKHGGVVDEVYDSRADEHICLECGKERQARYDEEDRARDDRLAQEKRDREALAAWKEGKPISTDRGIVIWP